MKNNQQCMKTQYDKNVFIRTPRQETALTDARRLHNRLTLTVRAIRSLGLLFKDFNFSLKLVTVADETTVSGREF